MNIKPRAMNYFTTASCLAVICLLVLMKPALGAPAQNLDPELIFYENTRDENGYSFSYKTKDGQYREERGEINAETGVLVVNGVYGFIGTDGESYEYNYVADEEGYRIVTKEPEIGFAPPLSNAALLTLVG
ncbi:larval cuticle protein 65Ag1-like [Anopheles ziemanni]|uniref:larval cuticle protein 65Ag1-like n=1 Tax=Anopheles coustani TaxID=139045 RepID=UPI002657DE10|nr:larval cuticle protein 65Ag1-like [Anopheles coustani]XP_058177968.1 larval cuticle protein 65Ag1-like [Anopheles ziemanni]